MSRRSRFVAGAAVWLPLLAWMAAIYWFSNQPDLPHAPDAVLDLIVKKAMHAAAYGVLAWLWTRALTQARVTSPALWALALTVAYAAGDELHQSWVPGRSGRVVDVGIDALGAVAALSAIHRRSARARQ